MMCVVNLKQVSLGLFAWAQDERKAAQQRLHSKTLSRGPGRHELPPGFGVGALLRRFGWLPVLNHFEIRMLAICLN
jgi:hypothetical protein